MTVCILGKKSELFRRLGISYALLVTEGQGLIKVIDLETANLILRQWEESNGDSTEDTAEVVKQLYQFGLAATPEAVFAKMAEVKIENGAKCRYKFDLHQCEVSIPHGFVVLVRNNQPLVIDGERADVTNLFDGVNVLENAIVQKMVTVDEAVVVCKQMIAADVPFTEDDLRAKFEVLPENVRQNINRERRRVRELQFRSQIGRILLRMEDFGVGGVPRGFGL